MKRPSTQRGFAGILVVLFLIALAAFEMVVGNLRLPSKGQHDMAVALRQLKALAETRDSILGFVMTNKRMPRTALAGGTERGLCATIADCTGLIPQSILGLPDDAIQYTVAPQLANSPIICDAANPFPSLGGNTPLALPNAAISIPNQLVCQTLIRARPVDYPTCSC